MFARRTPLLWTAIGAAVLLSTLGRAQAAMVFEGETAVGWCQFGRTDELPNIKHRKQYEAGLGRTHPASGVGPQNPSPGWPELTDLSLKGRSEFSGGKVVAMGTPEDVAEVEGSWTGRYLRGGSNECGRSPEQLV